MMSSIALLDVASINHVAQKHYCFKIIQIYFYSVLNIFDFTITT